MGVEKFSGWKTTDGSQFCDKESALKYEARDVLQGVVNRCYFEGEFSFNDFIAELKGDRDLIAELTCLVKE